MSSHAILHVDVDCFFVQVERHLNPTLVGKPVAVQQHQDTIAISYEARALGIKKHALPQTIRNTFGSAVHLVHVHTINGKASYKFYRQSSAAIYKALHSFHFPVERRGMDEAFVDATSQASATVSSDAAAGGDRDALLAEAGRVAGTLSSSCRSRAHIATRLLLLAVDVQWTSACIDDVRI